MRAWRSGCGSAPESRASQGAALKRAFQRHGCSTAARWPQVSLPPAAPPCLLAQAMLVGANAPLVLERRTRTSFATDAYDFYKPAAGMAAGQQEYPVVDGRLSQACYFQALDACFTGPAKHRVALGVCAGPAPVPMGAGQTHIRRTPTGPQASRAKAAKGASRQWWPLQSRLRRRSGCSTRRGCIGGRATHFLSFPLIRASLALILAPRFSPSRYNKLVLKSAARTILHAFQRAHSQTLQADAKVVSVASLMG